MRFWDTSSLVPLVVVQPATEATTGEFERDPVIVAWWATEVECRSAVARLEREGRLDGREVVTALDRLARLASSWQEVDPVARVRSTAARIVRTHPLRAADALQLAAALVAADDNPRYLPFVTLDERLALAARREGFPVVIPG